MFVTLRNHLITYMYSYKILRLVQINIEKIWGEYSNKAERSTVRGMRYIYTLIASKIHLMTGKIFIHYCIFRRIWQGCVVSLTRRCQVSDKWRSSQQQEE